MDSLEAQVEDFLFKQCPASDEELEVVESHKPLVVVITVF